LTFDGDKYVSPDLTALAEHITLNGITSIARQKNPDSIVWATLGNGDLISVTYERDQDVIAWAKHPLGGDGYAQSVCVIPEATEDAVYISVGRTIVGDAVYSGDEPVLSGTETVMRSIGDVTYIEKMASRTITEAKDAFFVDCGLSVDGPLGTPVDIIRATKTNPVVITAGDFVYSGVEEVFSGTEQVYKTGHNFANGDKIAIAGVLGMTELNGVVYTVRNRTETTFESQNFAGDTNINGYGFTTYVSGGTATENTASGFDHLNGETVSILVDGTTKDEQMVNDGRISPSVPVLTKLTAGLDPQAKLQPMRIVMNTQQGSSMGKVTHVSGLMISFMNTGAAKYGISMENLFPIDFTDPRWTNSCEIEGLFTGEVAIAVPGGFDPLNPIFIVSDGPMPLTVRCIIADIERTG